MSRLYVQKSPPLSGKIKANTAKNSILPMMAASLLTDDPVTIEDVPALSDVFAMCEVISALGISATYEDRTLHMQCMDLGCDTDHVKIMKKLRASFLISGPLLTRCGLVCTTSPGGCNIGSRPVDLHLAGFMAMGANIEAQDGQVKARTDRLRGADIFLSFPSVGATENLMMAATLAEGTTILRNAAAEPEVEDLAFLLKKMGAKIYGAGSSVIRIDGVKRMHGAAHTPIPDRIEAGTLMMAAAATGGNVAVQNVNPEHLKAVTSALRRMGANVMEYPRSIRVTADKRLRAADIKAMPYPGYPTDMQAQFMALASTAEGISRIEETVFDGRFRHVDELLKMGAKISLRGRTAVVDGVESLTGARVKAPDLRAGAAMVLAGLTAEGTTIIEDADHIDRGYENLDGMLASLGANIEREKIARPAVEAVALAY